MHNGELFSSARFTNDQSTRGRKSWSSGKEKEKWGVS